MDSTGFLFSDLKTNKQKTGLNSKEEFIALKDKNKLVPEKLSGKGKEKETSRLLLFINCNFAYLFRWPTYKTNRVGGYLPRPPSKSRLLSLFSLSLSLSLSLLLSFLLSPVTLVQQVIIVYVKVDLGKYLQIQVKIEEVTTAKTQNEGSQVCKGSSFLKIH